MITQPDSAPTPPEQMPASTWDIQAPYAPGEPQPIRFYGDPDAGGRDDVAGSVAESMANAEARFREHEADTHAQGSQIGDSMHLPPASTTGSAGDAYYDPPRVY